MTAKIKVAGSWRTLNGIKVKVAGSWRTVQTGKIKVGGAWRTFYTAFAVDYPPTVFSEGGGFATSGNTVATQVGAPTYTGGSGSYTYSWVKSSGSSKVNISSAGVAQPSFNGSSVYTDNPEVAIYTVTVTDVGMGYTATDTVEVTCTWIDIT